MGEIIGPVPVDALGQGGTGAQPGDHLTTLCPAVAQVEIAVEVRFVHRDQDDLFLTQLLPEALEALNVGRSLGATGLLEHLLALLPTQSGRLDQATQGAATDASLEIVFDPQGELLEVQP